MVQLIKRYWNSPQRGDLAKKDLQAGYYYAFYPEPLAPTLPILRPRTQEVVEQALSALTRADEIVGTSGRFLNHLLIRSESISSSWIEGNSITPKRLSIAEVLGSGKRVALDVIANVRATESAIDYLSIPHRRITREDIVELQHIIAPQLQRGLRQEQNWVGGPGWSPLRADFVPPPEEHVPRLVDNLAEFLSDTAGNPIVRAAIAHAQFETIHPFIDGNGRTGRALIHTILKRTGLVRNILIPISTVLAGKTDAYLTGLTNYRQGPERLDDWVESFAIAAQRAAENVVELSQRVTDVDSLLEVKLLDYRKSLGKAPVQPRKNSALKKILQILPSQPVLTAQTVGAAHNISSSAAHRALAELGEAGVLSKTKDHKGRLVCWTSDHHLDLVALTERSNRVGGEDTFNNPPKLGPPRPARYH